MTPFQIRMHEIERITKLVLKDKDLGKVRDSVIAAKHNESPAFVQRIRAKHGIDSSRITVTEPIRAKVLDDPETGIIADHKIAKRHGTTPGIVYGVRIKEGIEHINGNRMKLGRTLNKPNWRNELMLKWR